MAGCVIHALGLLLIFSCAGLPVHCGPPTKGVLRDVRLAVGAEGFSRTQVARGEFTSVHTAHFSLFALVSFVLISASRRSNTPAPYLEFSSDPQIPRSLVIDRGVRGA